MNEDDVVKDERKRRKPWNDLKRRMPNGNKDDYFAVSESQQSAKQTKDDKMMNIMMIDDFDLEQAQMIQLRSEYLWCWRWRGKIPLRSLDHITDYFSVAAMFFFVKWQKYNDKAYSIALCNSCVRNTYVVSSHDDNNHGTIQDGIMLVQHKEIKTMMIKRKEEMMSWCWHSLFASSHSLTWFNFW